jgi:hypothetical protein
MLRAAVAGHRWAWGRRQRRAAGRPGEKSVCSIRTSCCISWAYVLLGTFDGNDAALSVQSDGLSGPADTNSQLAWGTKRFYLWHHECSLVPGSLLPYGRKYTPTPGGIFVEILRKFCGNSAEILCYTTRQTRGSNEGAATRAAPRWRRRT